MKFVSKSPKVGIIDSLSKKRFSWSGVYSQFHTGLDFHLGRGIGPINQVLTSALLSYQNRVAQMVDFVSACAGIVAHESCRQIIPDRLLVRMHIEARGNNVRDPLDFPAHDAARGEVLVSAHWVKKVLDYQALDEPCAAIDLAARQSE